MGVMRNDMNMLIKHDEARKSQEERKLFADPRKEN